MTTQSDKYHLAMAGEYFVAAQLQRRGVSASITYGNAKSADVIAFTSTSDRVVVIEVKTTSRLQWVVGGRVPEESKKPWVFVHLPENKTEEAKYFILSQCQLHKIIAPIEAEYFRKYKEKHGIEYGEKAGVVNISRKLLAEYEDEWETIIDQLQT